MYYVTHRTQILLEPWQYEALKARVQQRGLSLSALIREIVTDTLMRRHRRAVEDLRKIRGIAEGPGDLGKRHDDDLYPGRGRRHGLMERAFADSGAWLDYVDRAARTHAAVCEVLEQCGGRLVTSNFVFDVQGSRHQGGLCVSGSSPGELEKAREVVRGIVLAGDSRP
jgi:hypothetical protein